MIDAAGAIYVIGGKGGGTTYFNDVWASTDGGAGRTRRVVGGYWDAKGARGVLGCIKGFCGRVVEV